MRLATVLRLELSTRRWTCCLSSSERDPLMEILVIRFFRLPEDGIRDFCRATPHKSLTQTNDRDPT